ncbi:bifunctional [glutamine synthetase] adenylyltransferase/[glutamine synthetase]-adenylyl-L-tyrosine phosphorylase [Calidifontibacter terrae]
MTLRATDLARAGFDDPTRGASLLSALPDWPTEALLGLLAGSADPDQAALGLCRLYDELAGPERAEVARALTDPTSGRERLVNLFGASSALTDVVVRRPEMWRDVVGAELADEATYRALISDAVGDQVGEEACDALRIAYRRHLVRIAAVDVAGDSVEELPKIAEALADIAGAALQAAHDIAVREHPHGDRARLSVIAMGKCGARELNYISDVDVVFAAEPAEGVDEDEALAIATRVASEIMRICSTHSGEGTLWEVDAALRPEGKQGPLVRTVASHKQYYERWAKTWEFQALLKARPIAGDPEVGQAYLDAVGPMVWEAAKRENFVDDVQAMRRRVEDHVPAGEAARQIKLGPGGLRDVEFSMQLLQLVHGRTDQRLRLRSTLAAIDALSRLGYIGRSDAAAMDNAYRVLRALEHRVQLAKMRRTHLMPTSQVELRRLGRGLRLFSDPVTMVEQLRQAQSREVRRLHERIFYRPLLSAVARLSDDEARLSPESAADRLQALGYRDPKGAIRHLEALTAGVTRRAAIQRTLLPVMLHWFAQEAAPDQGLLAFRKISDTLGTSHWYLKMLRDEGSAAETLARVLAKSRYVADLLERAPSAAALLGDAGALVPLQREAIITAMKASAARQEDDDRAVLGLRSTRRTELIRIAMAELSGSLDVDGLEKAITDLTAATLHATLGIAVRKVERDLGERLSTRVAIIGMGRLGGRECSFASDADVLFVHDPVEGAVATRAQSQAETVVNFVRRELGSNGPDPALVVDADLRPEGKAGPIVRTLESYAAYYDRWSEGWEAQALLRATPIAGDAQVGAKFVELINPLRYPEGGMSEKAVRQIRTLKARMEAERIPRGGDRKRHFKLGHGGLSDVEWTVQLLQLQHAHDIPPLRHPGTLTPLRLLAEHGLLTQEEADELRESWELASRLRNASVLWRGRPVDSLPSDMTDANGIARVMGWPVGSGYQLGERYLRAARKSRAVVERVFYGETPDDRTWDPYAAR